MRRLPFLAVLFVFALVASACGAAAQASGIRAVTPLPPQTAATAAPTAIAMAVDVQSKLSGKPPYHLEFSEMYSGRSVRYGLTLSDYLKALDGKQVTMEGYMAPPLKPSLDFFVLTEVPLAICPFCASSADWPDNIIAVYLDGMTTQPTSAPLRITGRLEIGSKVDASTGFVSMVRLYADKLEIVGG